MNIEERPDYFKPVFLFTCHPNEEKGDRIVDEFIPLISQVGFPIVVSFYLLYRIETKLDMVVQSIQNLPERMKERN